MAGEKLAQLSLQIGKKLRNLSPILANGSIFKVPERLRKANEKAYEPYILAIGPYHRGKPHLQKLEENKKWYLKKLLVRKGETENDVTKYIKAMKALEERARACYADHFVMDRDEFAEMMLFDGCFIVELLRRYAKVVPIETGDSLISLGWINKKLARDLLLVENQLPFFVVEELFNMTKMDSEKHEKFLIRMIFYFFAFSVLPEPSLEGLKTPGSPGEIKHLLSLVHDNWFYSSTLKKRKSSMENIYSRNMEKRAGEKFYHALSSARANWFTSGNSQTSDDSMDKKYNLDIEKSGKKNYWKFISCATELIEAGIKFKKVEAESLFDINFRKGVMEIPRLEITAESESLFRNLILYEQFFSQEEKSISNYIKFMDCLINSSKDVELLCKCNILHNCLGDHEVVANMFNRLGDFVTLSPDSYYADIFHSVNQHCSRRLNKWMANLKLKYFNTPWAFISFFAASLLLLLTLIQTLVSVLGYRGKRI